MRFSVRTYAAVALIGMTASLALLGREFLRREEPAALPPTGSPARALYDAHCAVCHGPSGKGDGRGASVLRQAMPDFTDSAAMRALSDRFLFEIIKKGGSQFGRSNAMPSWGMQLSDEEIQALVAYIRSLTPRTSPGSQERKEAP
jgi:mono/diheme cytochrome c family protein